MKKFNNSSEITTAYENTTDQEIICFKDGMKTNNFYLSSIESFKQYISKIKKYDIHEIISGDKPVKLYLDIEYERVRYPNNSAIAFFDLNGGGFEYDPIDHNKEVEPFLKAIKYQLFMKAVFDTPTFYILERCRVIGSKDGGLNTKFSYHITANVKFKNKIGVKQFIELVIQELKKKQPKEEKCPIDTNPYGARVVGHSYLSIIGHYKDKGGYLKPVSGYEGKLEDYLVTYTGPNNSTSLINMTWFYKEEKKITVSKNKQVNTPEQNKKTQILKDLIEELCVEESYENLKQYIDGKNHKDYVSFIMSFGTMGEEFRDLAHRFSQLGKAKARYNYSSCNNLFYRGMQDGGITKGSFFHFFRTSFPERNFNIKEDTKEVVHFREDFKLINDFFVPDVEVDTQYLSEEHLDKSKIGQVLWSGTNTGKTTLISRLIKGKPSVISIVPRVAITDDHKGKLGLEHY